MNKIVDALGAAATGMKEAFGTAQYQLVGKMISCPHCGRTEMQRRNTPLQFALLTCANCGTLQWFESEPERV